MPNENFVPTYSTDIIYRGQDPDRCLTDDLDAVELSVSDLYNVTATKANMSHTHSAYAPIAHEHEEYAPLLHDHYDYSMSDHTHSEYADVNHSHAGYASSSHIHSDYAAINHEHSGYATTDHTHSGFAASSHTHSDYASTSHTHTAESLVSMANALFATSSNGGVEYSYGSDSGKNVLTEISNMTAGLHTIYSIAGTAGNPKTTESWRMLVHKTSVTIGWVLAFDAQGSIYSNYQSAAGTFKGWRCIYDVTPPILWMGEYWCTDTQTVTPSKPLSECRNGWVLVWSDYDTANETATNGDCFTTVIPKWNPNHVKWSGQSFIAAVPTNLTAEGVISFCGKRLYVHDTKITGNTANDVSPANDCCLRAIYEY